MAKATRICRTCGKEYEYCHTERPANVFRWQEVACSPECGEKYLEAILISRGLAPKPAEEKKTEAPAQEKKSAKKKNYKTEPKLENSEGDESLTD